MGQIINLDTFEGEVPTELTETGKGGLLSSGYLHDAPAAAAIEATETPQFVLTNAKQGVQIEKGDGTESIRPGSGYRTIGVVTDKRLLLIVGDGDGDKQFSIPLSEVEQVDSETSLATGRLTFHREGNTTWHVECDKQGLSDLTTYLSHAAQAWVHVESILDDVKRTLVTATEHRDNGEHDAALATVREASERLETARETATEFSAERAGTALVDRVDSVSERCVRTLGEVRRSRAHRDVDTAEDRWRADDYEAAYDAYEGALAEYDAILSLPADAVENAETVREERERLVAVIEQLEQSPLREAVEADNEAIAADDPAAAADHWAASLSAYRTVLELDWGAEERRFVGDPAKIRERLETVAENLIADRRTVATDAMEAGDWYADAEQHEVAREEYLTARDAFEAALEAATDCYPDAVAHLQAELEAVERRLERTETRIEGDSVDVDERFDDHETPDFDLSASSNEDQTDQKADRTTLADIESIVDTDEATADRTQPGSH